MISANRVTRSRSHFTLIVPLVGTLVFFGACTASPTQIILAIDSELSIPDEIDKLVISLQPQGEPSSNHPSKTFKLLSRDDSQTTSQDQNAMRLPATVAITAGEDFNTDHFVEVVLLGLKETPVILFWRARLTFTKHKIRMLRVMLERACLTKSKECHNSGMVCRKGECVNPNVFQEELEEYDKEKALTPIEAGTNHDVSSDACSDGMPCYTGPAETKNVGVCKEGVWACRNGGAFCDGQVLPQESFQTKPAISDDDEIIDYLKKWDHNCDGKIEYSLNGTTPSNPILVEELLPAICPNSTIGFYQQDLSKPSCEKVYLFKAVDIQPSLCGNVALDYPKDPPTSSSMPTYCTCTENPSSSNPSSSSLCSDNCKKQIPQESLSGLYVYMSGVKPSLLLCR